MTGIGRLRPFLAALVAMVAAMACLPVPAGLAVTSKPVTTTSSGATFFGSTVLAGSTVPSARMIASELQGAGITITSATTTCVQGFNQPRDCTRSVQASGQLLVGTDRTPLAFTIDYEGDDDWTITIAAGAAGASYAPPGGAPVDLNQVSGTISMADGVESVDLAVAGVTYDGRTLSGTADITASGITATLALSTLIAPTGAPAGSLVVTVSNSAPPSFALQLGTGLLIPVTLDYTDADNWTASVPGGTSLPTATYPATVSGSVGKSGGVPSATLSVTAQIGDASVGMSATLTPAGISATGTVADVSISGWSEGRGDATNVTLTTGTVTVSSLTRSASLSGTFAVGTSTVTASADYYSASQWDISIADDSQGESNGGFGYGGASFNSLSGTISMTTAGLSTSLVVTGVTVGDATFDMTATITPQGFQASAVANDLTIGGFTLESASITIDTINPAASITAALKTDAGSFDVAMSAATLPGGGYDLTISASGADLDAGTADFKITQFGFTWTSDVPATGCTTLDVAVTGEVVMGNNTYDLQDAEIGVSCSTLTKFVFDLQVTHTPSFTNDGGGKTQTVTLEVNWFGDGTDSPYQQTFGSKGQFKGPQYSYVDGFFGSVDLSYKRSFSEEVDDRTFSKDIEVGLGFSLAAYQATTGAAWTTVVDVMGYFDADRVSGDVSCAFEAAPSVDFSCSGKVKYNPSWAGNYTHTWDNL